MKKLCVFTGAATGTDPRFVAAADQLGQILASRNLGLVYGGGKSGLMGKNSRCGYCRAGTCHRHNSKISR
jgi:predicted Rossmann-fold nucleotide-binding protein